MSRSAGTPATGPDLGASGTAVNVAAIKRHLERLQKIADANGGTRASGTPGHEASVDYVAGSVAFRRVQVTLQEFEFPFFRDITRALLKRVVPRDARPTCARSDFRTMTYSGSGNVTAAVQGRGPGPAARPHSRVPPPAARRADFAGFTPGNIALMQRGTCTFQVKAEQRPGGGRLGA